MNRKTLAEQAASDGAAVALDLFQTDLDVRTKSSKIDYVSQADEQAQREIVARIAAEFPDDAIVGEENDAQSVTPDSGTVWIIDPIDGTTNFLFENPFWTTSVVAVRDTDPIAAANVLPALGDTYVAGTEGVRLNGDHVAVNDRADVESFVVAPILRFSFDQRGEFVSLFEELVRNVGDLRRFGSAQATLSLVARGSLDATVSTIHPNAWDTVAGAHMVEQAGGRVTDLHGDEWSPDSRGIVASNGNAHDELLALIGDL